MERSQGIAPIVSTLTDWKAHTVQATLTKFCKAQKNTELDILLPKFSLGRFNHLAKLIITEEQLKQFMKIANEEAFTDLLVVPFLRYIGFRSVLTKGHKDRSLEYGQDLRCFKLELPTGHWLYFAAQVKTQDLIYSFEEGKSKANVEKIINQINTAFEHEMFDIETGGKFLPDHIYLITSHDANEGARAYIQERIYRDKHRDVLICYGEFLLERILFTGFPETNQMAIINYLKTVKR